MISVQQVSRVYPVGRNTVRALHEVSLEVPAGAFVLVTGPSGSGKTTLLNLVGCLDQPTSGRIVFDGRDVTDLSERQTTALRRRIGFIFQSFALQPTASAYENVELGLRIAGDTAREHWDGRIRRSLAAVGLERWSHHRPYEMSGGQQQRVAIARALAIRPRLIIADEPTGDLDSKTATHVLALLRAVVDRGETTLLVSSHDPAAAEYATTVFALRDGVLAPGEETGDRR